MYHSSFTETAVVPPLKELPGSTKSMPQLDTYPQSDSFQQRLSIVIPVYNHQQMIRQVVLDTLKLEVPVIVVDDGSTDESRSRIQDIPGIRILGHKRNKGKGAALRTGFSAAAEIADWAATIDADGQHDPTELRSLFRAVPDDCRPIVLGIREEMGSREVPWTSRFGREFSNFWVWIAGGRKVADSQNGFRIYPLPESLQLNVVSSRYQFEVEILVKAMWSRLPIVEVPISVNYCPGEQRISHYRPFVDFLRNSAVFNRLIWKRILRAFHLPISYKTF